MRRALHGPLIFLAILASSLSACSGKEVSVPTDAAKIKVESSAFSQGAAIPEKFTCKGQDVSPAMKWSGVPASAKSIVLICDDPDAPMGTWVHWVAYDIPPTVGELPEGVGPSEKLPMGGVHGKNSWGKLGYGGPCPPSGTHRYFFKVYALDASLGLPAGAAKKDVVAKMEGHVVGAGELMGTFTKK